MHKLKQGDQVEFLLDAVIQGIFDKKGLDVISLNLARIHSTVCDYFVICHGTSGTHAAALADSIEEMVYRQTGIKAARREGKTNAEWILIDFQDVVVHVFQESFRSFYQIEELWADAPSQKHRDTGMQASTMPSE